MSDHKQNIGLYRLISDVTPRVTPHAVEFHIRAEVRDRCSFDDVLFSSSGNVMFADFRAVQDFAERFNHDRPAHLQVSPADLNAAALMDEMLHYAVTRYRETVEPDVIERALAEMDDEMGSDAVDGILVSFLGLFPNTEVFRSRISPAEYLEGTTGAVPNRVLLLEELLISRVCNENPAFEPVRPLIGDDELRNHPIYEKVETVFSRPPKKTVDTRPIHTSLLDLLREPARRAPYSLRDQLAFIRFGWGIRIAPFMDDRLAMGVGLLAEEFHMMEMKGFGGGPGPVEVPTFVHEPEGENFSPDIHWMPRVVMVAKNALVWLDQLSKKYGRPIGHLDAVPEEEIARLARWGFNALWLIGVWQRSEASRKLKVWTGNPDAAPSAYSLFDYVIAEELGGEEAVVRFSETCRRYGIRLASDMVPNHTGIDSTWVREHPEWFIQLPYPPYPSYRYTSETIGGPDGPILQVEDGYFDRSDAAVTFRRQDRHTGEERFIYHGNDGTGMPWNDTAQLDFTRADVREAVTQTILRVARLFSIIRFDAAMVLTKKHFHRLWYPEPGLGDSVPSRAAHGMKRSTFDQKMPNEFWREVVDRVAVEVPDTLLLAEAFWLLEGYFVRTLGMHRVYNNAFMHMLKKEDNAEYRDVIRNTVAFEPEILKRYVNFMSNPDEETAIEQFGDGDKYFGVCVLMSTLPGLPMFGHGQVEGLREKYGMEYRRAYLDEKPRAELIARHEREIVPIAARRHLFAEVTHFHLFDFDSESGEVNENVFAFCNGLGPERALVLYNNRYESARGRVQRESLDEAQTRDPLTLAQALSLTPEPDEVVTYRDLISGHEYVMTGSRFTSYGLVVQLRGYEYRVLTDFEVRLDDDSRTYAQLAARLNGAGVASLDGALSEMYLQPVVDVVTPIVHAALAAHPRPETSEEDLETASRIGLEKDSFRDSLDRIFTTVADLADLPKLGVEFQWRRSSRYRASLDLISWSLGSHSPVRATLVVRRLLTALEEADESQVAGIVEGVVGDLGLAQRHDCAALRSIAGGLEDLTDKGASKVAPITRFVPMAESDRVRDALSVHEFGGTLYFNKERFETWAAAAFCEGALLERRAAKRKTARFVADHYDAYRRLIHLMEQSDFNWTSFRRRIRRIRQPRRLSRKTINNAKTNT